GTKKSTSSFVKPAFSITLIDDSGICLTANLNTSRPFITKYPSLFWYNSFPPAPFAPSSNDNIPLPSVTLLSTAAPEPSPNSTQVLRSFQSVILDHLSTPTIRNFS